MLGNYYYILILLIFSLFLNLGIFPLFLEEPRRAVVALEMTLSGNYIVPTIMGELYFAKPPLFNWILILSSKLIGSFSEFAVRLPTVISLILIGIFNYLFIQKYFNKEVAFFSSLIFMTSGTIYYYFSILGEIDIFYSLIIYLCIISVIFFFTKNQLNYLYIFSFSFAGFGFLTKGFPSIVFLYGTLFFVFLIGKRFKNFFSIYHILGIFIFSLIVGFYFYFYNYYHPILDYLQFLWSESSSRTVVEENKITSLAKHMFVFPLKTLIALLPWSFLILFLFRKNTLNEIFSNNFLKIALVVFLGNYFVYWISPGANQRYIYMLYPFFIVIFIYFYFKYKNQDRVKEKFFNIFVLFIILVFDFISLGLPFLIKTLPDVWTVSVGFKILVWIIGIIIALFIVLNKISVESGKIYNATLLCLGFLSIVILGALVYVIPVIWIISIFFSALFFILLIAGFKSEIKIVYLLISLIMFRILFDLVYFPVKSKSGDSYKEKINGVKVAEIANLQNTELFYYGDDKLPHGLLFYIERERHKILKRNLKIEKNYLYLSKAEYIKNYNIEKLFTFEIKKEKYVLFKVY